MKKNEFIESNLSQKFFKEKLLRKIQDCQDIEMLRNIAIELLKVNEQKSMMAEWFKQEIIKNKYIN